jgi:hypothetical protein
MRRIKNVIVKNEELSVTELKNLLDAAHAEIERLTKKLERLEKSKPPTYSARVSSSSNPPGAADEPPGLKKTPSETDFTLRLLAEVDSMGIDGDEMDLLTSDDTMDERAVQILTKQSSALKAEVKKHIKLQVRRIAGLSLAGGSRNPRLFLNPPNPSQPLRNSHAGAELQGPEREGQGAG